MDGQDELLWGAAWLRRASNDDSYLNYLQNNGKTLGADDNINEFGWDNKHAGLNVLVSKVKISFKFVHNRIINNLVWTFNIFEIHLKKG